MERNYTLKQLEVESVFRKHYGNIEDNKRSCMNADLMGGAHSCVGTQMMSTVVILFSDSTMVKTQHYTSVQSCGIQNTKSEPLI